MTRLVLLILLTLIISEGLLAQTDPLRGVFTDPQFKVQNIIANVQDSSIVAPTDYNDFIDFGIKLYDKGNYSEALSNFKKAKKVYSEIIGENAGTEKERNPYPDYYIGSSYAGLMQYDSAIYYLTLSIKEVPYFLDGYSYLGYIHVMNKDYDQALKTYNEGLKINSTYDQLLHNVAYTYYLMGDIKKTLKTINKNIEANPLYPSSYILKAWIFEEKRNLAKVDQAFDAGLAASPKQSEILNARANYFLRRSLTREAKADLEVLMDLDPSDSAPKILMSLCDLYDYELVKGIKGLAKILTEFYKLPENVAYQPDADYVDREIVLLYELIDSQEFDEKELEIFGGMIREVSIDNSVDKTVKECKTYLEKNPKSELVQRCYLYALVAYHPNEVTKNIIENAEAASDSYSVKYIDGRFNFNRGLHFIAIKKFNEVLDKEPDFGLAHYYKALSTAEVNLHPIALGSYNKAIELMPNYFYAYNDRGNCFERQQMYDSAILDYKKAISINPNFTWPYNGLGLSYRELKKYDSAKYYFEKAIELDADNYMPYMNLGISYLNQDNSEKAIELFDMSLEINPNNDLVLSRRSKIYSSKGKIDKAIDDINMCIQLQPENGAYYTDRGDLYTRKESIELAKEDFRLAIKYGGRFNIYPKKRLADMFRFTEEFDSAHYYYNAALMVFPKYASAEFGLAFNYYQQQQYDSAIYHFHQAGKINPEFSGAFGNLGWTYYLVGDYENCVKYSVKAIELDKYAFYAMFNHALSKLCLGETEESIELYISYKAKADKNDASLDGAIKDLEDLRDKGQFVQETNRILKTIFNR
ncbi:tetratricopeptide repeat protein [Reichenbachiella versicolor]|uniref:tetratricopeptide repeat protein n=1 Tax=Reichenbachiella versicolor TaxID=1821036 RepID=UPI000D6E8DD4|nr:tetratricopeptide repeat protein [Reichenbachiella versicolor]